MDNQPQVLCLPRTRALLTQILEQAHGIVGHFRGQRTCEYIKHWYWWPQMVADTNMFCRTCGACQRAKAPTHKPTGLLHSLPIPTKPWDSVGTNFIGPFPEAKGYNYLLGHNMPNDQHGPSDSHSYEANSFRHMYHGYICVRLCGCMASLDR